MFSRMAPCRPRVSEGLKPGCDVQLHASCLTSQGFLLHCCIKALLDSGLLSEMSTNLITSINSILLR